MNVTNLEEDITYECYIIRREILDLNVTKIGRAYYR